MLFWLLDGVAFLGQIIASSAEDSQSEVTFLGIRFSWNLEYSTTGTSALTVKLRWKATHR